MKLEVGQKVWVKWTSRHHVLTELDVTSIGRKWVYLQDGRYRVAIGERILDGGGFTSPGTLYLSKREYDDNGETSKVWTRFRRSVERLYSAPEGVTLDDIDRARGFLRLPEDQ